MHGANIQTAINIFTNGYHDILLRYSCKYACLSSRFAFVMDAENNCPDNDIEIHRIKNPAKKTVIKS